MIKGTDITCTFGEMKSDIASYEKGKVRAVAGKGGTGKTTIAAGRKPRETVVDRWSQGGGTIAAIIVEEEHYDLLVMGRPEGPGCYCPINHILRMIIDTLTQNYDHTVIECEAGLEHLSRRLTRDVDVMLVVLDMTLKSLKMARRLKRIAEEINVGVKKLVNIRNKIPSDAG